MEFLVEIFFAVSIICVILLVLRLKVLKHNVDSSRIEALHLKDLLNEQKTSTDFRESRLHTTISGLQSALSQEKKDIQVREGKLKATEDNLLKSLSVAEKDLAEEIETHKKVLSQKKSSEVRLGHIAEKLAPFLDEFDFDPEACIFLGQPIDYISFDDEIITFIEVKSGKSQLNSKQRHIRDLIKSKQVAWKEIRIK